MRNPDATTTAARRTVIQSAIGAAILLAVPAVRAADAVIPSTTSRPPPLLKANARRDAVVKVLDDALATMDMGAAVTKHGASLSQADKDALLRITAAELAHLRSARQKLKGKMK